MEQLQVIVHDNRRVLTTNQLAESYGTDAKHINDNFQNNSPRYKEGKHFFELKGEELKAFKATTKISGNLKFAPVLYLWTEKGAWLHAKSLNTDEAWDAYEMLVDDYFNIKDAVQPKTQAELIAMIAQTNVEQERRLKAVEEKQAQLEAKQDNISEIVALSPKQDWRKTVSRILSSIAEKLGGGSAHQEVRSESYSLLEARANCKLSIRVKNKRKNLALSGATKTAINKVTKLDVIDDDARLTEIYLAVVKEMAIKHAVEVDAS